MSMNNLRYFLFQAMSKLIHTEWGLFLKEEQLTATKMTASRNRKLSYHH